MPQSFEPQNADFDRAVREAFGSRGLMGTIGAWLVEVKPGEVVIELPYSPRISRAHGYFHDAVVGALGADAGVSAALALMPAGSGAQVAEYKVNFLAPAKGLLLRAVGRVVLADAVLTTTRVDVTVLGGEQAEDCAILQMTVLRVDKDAPEG